MLYLRSCSDLLFFLPLHHLTGLSTQLISGYIDIILKTRRDAARIVEEDEAETAEEENVLFFCHWTEKILTETLILFSSIRLLQFLGKFTLQ